MIKQYQILKRLRGKGNKWEFVAHGAVYRDNEADDIMALIRSHGTHIVKRLPL